MSAIGNQSGRVEIKNHNRAAQPKGGTARR
jgi:hypothetical protein